MVALARELHSRGHSLLVTAFYPGGPLVKDLCESGVRVVTLNKKGRWDVFGFLRRLIALVRHEKPDVLYAYLPVPNLLSVLLKPIFPKVRMVWGVRASNVDFNQYDWLARAVFRLECLFSRFADLIIVNSNAGRNYHVAQGFPESKMVVIPNGIDTVRFKPDSVARSKARAEWGIKENEKLVGLVARIDPMKDHPTFLKAAELLIRESPDIRFVCVGDGPEPYKSDVLKLASDLGFGGKIVWTGSRSDMPDVYNALDVAVSSSYGEGFPNVLGEAMACGVPCVATDVGDSAWIVADTGVVVAPRNPEILAQGISECLKKKSAALAVACRVRIVDMFSLEQLVDKTEKALLDLMEAKT